MFAIRQVVKLDEVMNFFGKLYGHFGTRHFSTKTGLETLPDWFMKCPGPVPKCLKTVHTIGVL